MLVSLAAIVVAVATGGSRLCGDALAVLGRLPEAAAREIRSRLGWTISGRGR